MEHVCRHGNYLIAVFTHNNLHKSTYFGTCLEYFMVKIDGLPIPEGRLVENPYINQYVGTVLAVLFQVL